MKIFAASSPNSAVLYWIISILKIFLLRRSFGEVIAIILLKGIFSEEKLTNAKLQLIAPANERNEATSMAKETIIRSLSRGMFRIYETRLMNLLSSRASKTFEGDLIRDVKAISFNF